MPANLPTDLTGCDEAHISPRVREGVRGTARMHLLHSVGRGRFVWLPAFGEWRLIWPREFVQRVVAQLLLAGRPLMEAPASMSPDNQWIT